MRMHAISPHEDEEHVDGGEEEHKLRVARGHAKLVVHSPRYRPRQRPQTGLDKNPENAQQQAVRRRIQIDGRGSRISFFRTVLMASLTNRPARKESYNNISVTARHPASSIE
jgi:hypothetical protein